MPYIAQLISKKEAPRESVAEPANTTLGWGCTRLVVSACLFCYASFNCYLYKVFTPVYRSTQCGDQVADLQDFSIGVDVIQVTLGIELTCQNPNGYRVAIASATPGRVFAGEDRSLDLGTVTLVEGSTLPEYGAGTIAVKMDTKMPVAGTGKWLSLFLSDPVVPLFLELHFDVGISMSFGLATFGTSAPFVKKCGLHLAGMLVNTDKRLGPLICRNTFEEVEAELSRAESSNFQAMVFSAGQMDPERIRMGEAIKNVTTLGAAILCYAFSGYVLWSWWIARSSIKVASDRSLETIAQERVRSQSVFSWLTVEPPESDVEAGGVLSTVANILLGGRAQYGRVETAPVPQESSPSSASPQSLWSYIPSSRSSSRSTAASDSSSTRGAASDRPSGLMTLLTCTRSGKPRPACSSPLSP